MCGVVGIITLKDDLNSKDLETVLSMNRMLIHRGPSQQGHFQHKRCIIGNTRLSIIDLSNNGSLPMSNSTKDVWIAYNGEVSNFKTLKQKYRLEDKYHFSSTTDTEVLIYLYQEFGIAFLNELSGMFAFCILDLREMKTYVVRDFFGINPMFFIEKENKIYFGSEIKALLETGDYSNDLNHESIFHFFSLAYIPGNRTPYNAIQEIRGGYYLEVDLATNHKSLVRYYKTDFTQNFDLTEKDAISKTRTLMLDSVERNLISDAPLGLTNSGGIDSSAMIGMVKALGRNQNIHTFSLKMGEKSFDESKFQRLMAKFAGTQHHEIHITPERVIESLVKHIAYLDEPSGDGSNIPSFLLAKEAKKYVDVLFSGEGGDEVFNAYATHGAFVYRKLYRRYSNKPLRDIIYKIAHMLPASYSKLSFDFKLKRFTEGAELDTPDAHLYWRHVFTKQEKNELLCGIGEFNCPTSKLFSDLFYQNQIDNDLNRISLLDLEFFFHDDLMVKNDRTFMAHSIEGRFPLMDRILVDFVTKIPANMRIKGFKRRYIQKRAIEGFVPKSILRRKSFGLEMPHSIWLLDKMGTFADKYLNKTMVEKTGLLKWEAVQKYWEMHKSGKKDYGRAIWCILNYLIWFEMFIEKKDYKQYLHDPIPTPASHFNQN